MGRVVSRTTTSLFLLLLVATVGADEKPAAEQPLKRYTTNGRVSISLPGRSRGEAWVDVESGDVLRLDEYLTRRFEFREPKDRPGARMGWIALERNDLSIRYHRVTFENPAETLLLPRSVERSWTLQGNGFVPRYFTSQQFSDHRRFLGAGRLIETPAVTREPGIR